MDKNKKKLTIKSAKRINTKVHTNVLEKMLNLLENRISQLEHFTVETFELDSVWRKVHSGGQR